MAYLITCSAKKIKSSQKLESTIEQLSFDTELGEARKELIDFLGLELDWSRTLLAWQLYDGKVYRKISKKNWEAHNDKVKILSALFGWVKPTDLLPYYDLKMDQKIPLIGKTVIEFWQDKGALQKLISEDDVDLLSQLYKKAIDKKSILKAKDSGVIFTDYGDQKGGWLNTQLTNLQ